MAFDVLERPAFAPSVARIARPDLTISASAQDFMLLAQRRQDPDTCSSAAAWSMEGDTELGLVVKNALDALELPLLACHWSPRAVLAACCPSPEGAPAFFEHRTCRRPEAGHERPPLPAPAPIVVYSCSGCSSAAQLANHVAVPVDTGPAWPKSSCIAGVGATCPAGENWRASGRPIIALDGCPLV